MLGLTHDRSPPKGASPPRFSYGSAVPAYPLKE